LIDPSARDPARHLSWSSLEVEGRRLCIAVPQTFGPELDPYAVTSIEVFGLNRPGLVDERTVLLERLEFDFQGLQDGILMATKLDAEALATFLPRLRARLVRFLEEGLATKPYSACAKKFIDESVNGLIHDLEVLEAKYPK
jgi:hypothetical protein